MGGTAYTDDLDPSGATTNAHPAPVTATGATGANPDDDTAAEEPAAAVEVTAPDRATDPTPPPVVPNASDAPIVDVDQSTGSAVAAPVARFSSVDP